MTKYLLFCIPFAGGSATIYQPWSRITDSRLEVVPIELAGRGSRMGERGYLNVEEAVRDIVRIILARLKDEPFLLLGHSMGGLLAYETARALEAEAGRSAQMLIISAHEPPHLRMPRTIHLLEDEAFVQELLQLNGMSEEVASEPALLELFLPIIRSDFKLLASYRPTHPIRTVSCPIQVLSGIDDQSIDQSKLSAWHEYTTSGMELSMLAGDHFYVREQGAEIIRIVQKLMEGRTRIEQT